jgi:hypothetical protein
MLTVEIPQDRQVWESAIAHYWWEGDVLISRSKSVLRTLELMQENARLVKEITGGKPAKLLIYLASSPRPDKAVREFSAKVLPELYSSMAMLADDKLVILIMRLLFALKPAPIPMKSFKDVNAAMMWLKGK